MIEIRTAEDFSNIRNNLSGSYILMNDIDFSGVKFIPIGDERNPFTGFIEGQGYRLKNIMISGTEDYNGIFRCIDNAKITNLSFENCTVNGDSSTGVLCGRSHDSKIINLNFINCTVNGNSDTGIVAGFVAGSQYNNLKINNSIVNIVNDEWTSRSGLICGSTQRMFLSNCYCENSKIYNTFYVGTVTGYGDVVCNNCFFHNIEILRSDPNKYFQTIGGITGRGNVDAAQCYINVKITDTAGWSGKKYFHIGGVNGESYGGSSGKYHNISNCAIFIDITSYGGDFISHIGGISPASDYSYIENCYIVMNVNTNASFGQYCGSLFGYTFWGDSEDTVISTHYNADLNVPIDNQAIPKTTDELKIRDTFQNWDFENIWGIHPEINEGYPYLRIFYPEVPDEPDPGEMQMNQTQEYYLYATPEKVSLTSIKANNTYIINDIPQQFSPVIIHSGDTYLQRAFFKDENNDLTLINKETLQINGDKSIYLTYTNIKDLHIKYKEKEIIPVKIIGSQVLLDIDDEDIGSYVDVAYMIKDSFILEIKDNRSYLKFSDDYDEVNVIYEANKISPFYIADEINLNPYINDFDEGFIFISNKQGKFKSLEITVSPTNLLARKGQFASIKVKVLDSFNNPIYPSGQVKITAKYGKIKYYNETSGLVSDIQTTDIYGNVYAIYEVTNENIKEDIITVEYNGHKEEESISLYKSNHKEKLAFLLVETNKNFIYTKENAKITAIILDKECKPMPNIPVEFKDETGIKRVNTDNQGKAIYTFKIDKINEEQKDYLINISAKVNDILLEDYLTISVFKRAE